MVINQGDIYWLQLEAPEGLEPRIPHPHVVIQDNALNHDPSHTTVVLFALTSNLNRVTMPGNVLLDLDEGHLTRQSVVEVPKVSIVEKTQLGDYIGSLSEQRITQILAGMQFLQRSFLGLE